MSNLKFFGSIYELIGFFFTLAVFSFSLTSIFPFLLHMHNDTCIHKITQPLSLTSLSLFLSASLPSTSYFGVFCMVPGCLEAVCICMGETVDRDGIWHVGTRSKRSIWSHKNRRKPSSHPYKTPTDSRLCQPWLLHLLSSCLSLSLSLSRFFPSIPACRVPTSRPAWLCDYALW